MGRKINALLWMMSSILNKRKTSTEEIVETSKGTSQT